MEAKGKKNLEKILKKAIMVSRKTDSTIVIQGESGIGKTHIIKKIAKEKNWGLLMRVLSNTTIEEIVGVPVIHNKDNVKIFEKIIPNWLQPVYDHKDEKPMILFLDEINRRVIPEQVLFSILDKKLVASKEFKKNVILIACINTGKEYNVQELEDRAIKNRLITIDFVMNNEDLIQMIDELGEMEDKKILALLLNSIIPSITKCHGEFNKDYVSLRNWKNLFYYLSEIEVKNINKLAYVFENDEFIKFLICPEIIDEVNLTIYQLKNNISETIEKYFKKKKKMPIEQQFEAQIYFISNIISNKKEFLERLIEKMSTILDNGLILGILKEVMPILGTNDPEKKAVIIGALNKKGIIQKVKSAF